jgi:hypothetical protein
MTGPLVTAPDARLNGRKKSNEIWYKVLKYDQHDPLKEASKLEVKITTVL